MQIKDQVILGIDPGTNIMGYGLIHVKNKKIELMVMDVLYLKRLDNQCMKMKRIFEKTLSLIEEYLPDSLAIEAPFYGKNVQSMLKLGRAQGIAMAAALYKNIPVFEYSPKKVKQSITGNGNASKEQVAAMLNYLLEVKEPPKYLDATDALGIAVCHYLQNTQATQNEQYTGWGSFISKNADRIIK